MTSTSVPSIVQKIDDTIEYHSRVLVKDGMETDEVTIKNLPRSVETLVECIREAATNPSPEKNIGECCPEKKRGDPDLACEGHYDEDKPLFEQLRSTAAEYANLLEGFYSLETIRKQVWRTLVNELPRSVSFFIQIQTDKKLTADDLQRLEHFLCEFGIRPARASEILEEAKAIGSMGKRREYLGANLTTLLAHKYNTKSKGFSYNNVSSVWSQAVSGARNFLEKAPAKI